MGNYRMKNTNEGIMDFFKSSPDPRETVMSSEDIDGMNGPNNTPTHEDWKKAGFEKNPDYIRDEPNIFYNRSDKKFYPIFYLDDKPHRYTGDNTSKGSGFVYELIDISSEIVDTGFDKTRNAFIVDLSYMMGSHHDESSYQKQAKKTVRIVYQQEKRGGAGRGERQKQFAQDTAAAAAKLSNSERDLERPRAPAGSKIKYIWKPAGDDRRKERLFAVHPDIDIRDEPTDKMREKVINRSSSHRGDMYGRTDERWEYYEDPIPQTFKENNQMTNKILQEYIMQNTPQQPKDASIIEIIADEVNETLNNLPEVQLASELLSEDELKSLFSPLARQVVTKVRNQIGKKIKGMVAEAISIEDFMSVIQIASGVDSIGQALANLTPAQLLAIRQIIAREDENSQYLSLIDQIQGARAADEADEEELDAQLPDEEPDDQGTDYKVDEDE